MNYLASNDMKPKFEIGNFARKKTDGKIVEKVISEDDWVSYLKDIKIAEVCSAEDVENVDVKTAFLTRLQELLATFDAAINVGWNNGWQADDAEYPLIDMDVVFKDGTGFCYGNVLDKTITAETVFDYDKD